MLSKETLRAEVELKDPVRDRQENTDSLQAVSPRAIRRRVWSAILADALRGSRAYVADYTGGRGAE